MLSFSDIKQYIPVKLCKIAGIIHLFQIYGQLTSDQITLERKISVGYYENRLRRSLCDFEQSNRYNCPYQLKFHLEINIG